MEIIRFIDSSGAVVYGVPSGENRANLVAGEILGEFSESDEVVAIERLLSPIAPTTIYGIGLNYRDHATETGAELPERPIIFMKPASSVSASGDSIQIPKCCQRGPEVDYEAELAVVIGKTCRDVSVDDALDYVLGYTIANDVSARRWQKHAGGKQWIKSKGFDGFCPLGPVMVTADDIPDPQVLGVRSKLNGVTMQDGNTRDMIFSVAEIISYLSEDVSLQPGTVILTGTPAGVGVARKPPVFMADGDQIDIEIESIGRLTNPVRSA